MSAELSELDILYSPSKWAKRLPEDLIFEKHLEVNTKNTEEVQKLIKCELNIPYGEGEREKIDIFGTDLPEDAPILIHIHGGYWQMPLITHTSNSFIAKNLYKNGIKSIYVGYELCPDVTVTEISKNIEKALVKSLEYVRKHKPRGVHLSGHSVGGQLVAALFQSFITALPTEEKVLFKSAFLLCGIYDLIPLIKTETNLLLSLDETSAKANSPLYQKLSSDAVFYVVVAEFDSPAFIEDGKKMHEYLEKLGIKSNYVFIKNVDHFDAIEKLSEEEYELTKLIIRVIKN